MRFFINLGLVVAIGGAYLRVLTAHNVSHNQAINRAMEILDRERSLRICAQHWANERNLSDARKILDASADSMRVERECAGSILLTAELRRQNDTPPGWPNWVSRFRFGHF